MYDVDKEFVKRQLVMTSIHGMIKAITHVDSHFILFFLIKAIIYENEVKKQDRKRVD